MKIYPKIPVVFEEKFPKNFVNDTQGWSFSQEELNKNNGKILTLDIDFGDYCSLNCPHCFRKNNKVDFGKNRLMDFDDFFNIISQAQKHGLRSVKFLGAGEPFENEEFLNVLVELDRRGIYSLVFTKGLVFGDDSLAKKHFLSRGISSGKELVDFIKKLKVSILLGFNSFDTKVQDAMVAKDGVCGVKDYTLKRNRALELLVEASFNKPNPTRLALIAAPITNQNIGEIFEIYSWARVRNLYVVTTPTMISGRCSPESAWHAITPSEKELVDLYTKIYEFNIAKGIQTFVQIKKEGVSSYAGAHPCNQVACGMYVTLTGKVLRCPGDDITEFGNIWQTSLAEIWKNSENFRRTGTFNCQCPPKKGKSIPSSLYSKVLANLEAKYS